MVTIFNDRDFDLDEILQPKLPLISYYNLLDPFERLNIIQRISPLKNILETTTPKRLGIDDYSTIPPSILGLLIESIRYIDEKGVIRYNSGPKLSHKLSNTAKATAMGIGLNQDYFEGKNGPRMISLFNRISACEEFSEFAVNFKLIGTGTTSVVLLFRNSAWKFSLDAEREYNLLKKVEEANEGTPRNILKVKQVYDRIAVELEFISGDSLEKILSKEHLNRDRTISYSKDILNGIRELRQAGIYHRDLHGGNVLIEEEKNRAVIIDLGYATKDPEEVYNGNRAYGGNNDLVSLGQLMYRMAVGRNLFKDEGFTCCSKVKERIRINRANIYSSKIEKEHYFKIVREKVQGELGKIIADLLNDGLYRQPPIERIEMFMERLQKAT